MGCLGFNLFNLDDNMADQIIPLDITVSWTYKVVCIQFLGSKLKDPKQDVNQ